MKSVQEFTKKKIYIFVNYYLLIHTYMYFYIYTYICATLTRCSTNFNKMAVCYSNTPFKVDSWCEVWFFGGKHKPEVWEWSWPLQQDEALNTAPSSVQTSNCSFPGQDQLHRAGDSSSGTRESKGLFHLIKCRFLLLLLLFLIPVSHKILQNSKQFVQKCSLEELQHPHGWEPQKKTNQFEVWANWEYL